MIQSQRNDLEPWYVKKKKFNTSNVAGDFSKKNSTNEMTDVVQAKQPMVVIVCLFCVIIFSVSSGVFAALSFFETNALQNKFMWYLLGSFISLILSLFFIFYQIGIICSHLISNKNNLNKISLSVKFLKNQIYFEEPRKGIPAPEMALYQFIQQVRAYAMEKAFLKQRQERAQDAFSLINGADPNSLLKRRWNDVMDSLNEFEIYLANDPKGIIEKLILKSPPQNMDVSQIFRDVADTFDTTWRRKGINIEQAIVTPLKANTNEAVLRRLLVGPWRSCVYFARRGNGVVFSAKSIDGKVIARWECEGMVFPQEFFDLMKNIQLDVNERIEKGMEIIALDPNSPNTLFALISFVTWIDLANVSGCDYEVKQGSEGLIIELRL